MSLPRDVQRALVHALPGLERREMLRPGYAVEYDFVQPTELRRSLETQADCRAVPRRPDQRHVRLRGGGGAGPGGGINAALARSARAALTLGRDEGYIGILVDDLMTRGCLEPYRMFTSRAEHRLLLRIDNADLRLTPMGGTLGSSTMRAGTRFEARRARFERNRDALERTASRIDDGVRSPAGSASSGPTCGLRTCPTAWRSSRRPSGDLDARAWKPRSSTRATSRASCGDRAGARATSARSSRGASVRGRSRALARSRPAAERDSAGNDRPGVPCVRESRPPPRR